MLLSFIYVDISLFRRPSRYINQEINSIHQSSFLRVALCFPDIYDIGMSHLGLKILYEIINNLPYASAERVFSPWIDMEESLRKESVLLGSLESNTPLKNFDIVGFSLQYELSYATVLNMLDLGGIPIRAEERNKKDPIVIGGGPCTLNPFPVSPFFDVFLIGDGEDAIEEIIDVSFAHKSEGDEQRESLLRKLSEIEGVFVPRFSEGNVTRRILTDLDSAPFPCSPVVPYTPIVHDRINIEISRGCTHACRFCQAGMIYRPLREREPDTVLRIAKKSIENTGHADVSFTSLSAGDYSQLLPLVTMFNRSFSKKRISLSLPSLRVGSINDELLKEMKLVRKTGFTIAPEAATSRLRNVINKNFNEDEYERALFSLFKKGWLNLKLYFMIGLPTETDEDVEAIPFMAQKALRIARRFTKRFVNINVGVSTFVPKPHTPFQWCGQIGREEVVRKKQYLKKILSRKGLKVKGHDERMSILEAAFSRGDERLASLIETAWRYGSRLDAWTEIFDYRKWINAMEKTGIDMERFAEREYKSNDSLPWTGINTGIGKDFLWKEYIRALRGVRILDCRFNCHGCGLPCKSGQYLSKKSVPSISREDLSPIVKVFSPIKLRMAYAKTGKIRHLSHLELTTAIIRGLRRADVPLTYSKGFHPTPNVSFGPPLSVGVSGKKEYLDMEVLPPFDISKSKDRINTKMPEGIKVINMFFIPKDLPSLSKFITTYKYQITSKEKLRKEDIEKRLKSEEAEWLLPMFVDFDVINERLSITLRDREEKKVKLNAIVKTILCIKGESLHIVRTGLYGWNNGWCQPDEIDFSTSSPCNSVYA